MAILVEPVEFDLTGHCWSLYCTVYTLSSGPSRQSDSQFHRHSPLRNAISALNPQNSRHENRDHLHTLVPLRRPGVDQSRQGQRQDRLEARRSKHALRSCNVRFGSADNRIIVDEHACRRIQNAPPPEPESVEQAYSALFELVRHIQDNPDVRIMTSRQMPLLFENPVQLPDAPAARKQFRTSFEIQRRYCAAGQLLALLGLDARPVARGQSGVNGTPLSPTSPPRLPKTKGAPPCKSTNRAPRLRRHR